MYVTILLACFIAASCRDYSKMSQLSPTLLACRPLYASWVPRKSIGAAGWDSTPAHEAHRLMVDSSPVVMEGTGVADGLMKRWRTAQDVARDFG